MRVLAWFLWLAIGLPAAAQSPLRFELEYPSTKQAWTASNNVIPFGTSGKDSPFDEARWQQILPRRFLPPLRCRLVAIAPFTNAGSAVIRYESLQIDLCMKQDLELGTDLDDNMRSPLLVLDGIPREIDWDPAERTRIVLDRGFPYDGQSHLLMDVQKVLDSSGANLPPGAFNSKTLNIPADARIPATQIRIGPPGSNAAHGGGRALVLKIQIPMRLEFIALEAFGAQRLVASDGESLRIGVVEQTRGIGAIRIQPSGDEHGVLPSGSPMALEGFVTKAGECTILEIDLPTCPEFLGQPLALRRCVNAPTARWSPPITPRLVLE